MHRIPTSWELFIHRLLLSLYKLIRCIMKGLQVRRLHRSLSRSPYPFLVCHFRSQDHQRNNVDSDDHKQHYRFYGNSFTSPAAAAHYDTMLKEAKSRDHRLLGKKLDLFLFNEASPGNVFFLPRGYRLYDRLVEHMRCRYLQEYGEVSCPVMLRSDVWKTSGHYAHYKQNMFRIDMSGKDGEEIHNNPVCSLKPA